MTTPEMATRSTDLAEIPSLTKAHTFTLICSFGMLNWVMGLLGMGSFDYPWYVDLPNIALTGWGIQSSIAYRSKVIARRDEWRKAHYEAWLMKEISPLPEARDWAEIERATDDLLAKGVEPTYERAVDLLKKQTLHEQEIEQKRLMQALRASRTCEHAALKVEWIGVNLNRRIVACKSCGETISDEVFDPSDSMPYSSDPLGTMIERATEHEEPSDQQVYKCPSCSQWHRPGKCQRNPFKQGRQ